MRFFFFFFNDTATTEIYTLSLHDALPISPGVDGAPLAAYCLALGDDSLVMAQRLTQWCTRAPELEEEVALANIDRKSTRLNSSHANISYAVFCLKKKKQKSL